MFIFPSVIALLIGIATLFIGKDDPEELGWNRAEEIWEEPVDKENIDSQGMTKWEIFKNISWEILLYGFYVFQTSLYTLYESVLITGHRYMCQSIYILVKAMQLIDILF